MGEKVLPESGGSFPPGGGNLSVVFQDEEATARDP